MTLVFAHRGAWGQAPQNSLAAFARALELGVDGIELDVRGTHDGEAVVVHDAVLAGVPVAATSYAELCASPGGASVPRLAEVLELVRGSAGLDIEVKETAVAETVVELVAAWPHVDRVLITSFHEEVVVRAGAHGVRTGLVVGDVHAGPPLERLARCGADCLALEASLAQPVLLRRAQAARVPLLVWTVNEPEAIERLLGEHGVSALITDRPELALERRRALSGRTEPSARR